MSDNDKFRKDMLALLRNVRSLVGTRLPGIIKVEGLSFIKENFDAKGFNTGSGVEKWPARKPPKGMWRRGGKTDKKGSSQQLRGTKAGIKFLKDANRSLLVKRGHLRRAWDRDTSTGDAQVAFRNTLPYAEAHNEGIKPQPERRMIGDSTALDKRIMDKIDREMQKLLNP